MAKFTVDGQQALKVVEGKIKLARRGVPIATRPAAEYMRNRMQDAVGVRSGRLRDAIVVRWNEATDTYNVRILFSRFPSFFYAILFFDIYDRVIAQHSAQAKRIAESRFAAWWNREK